MSLRVWLPLTGDLHNQGLDGDLIITAIGTTTFVNGKIGTCYQRASNSTQTSTGININSNLLDLLGTEASVAMWVKPLGTHTNYNGTLLSSGNWNRQRWTFGVSQDNTKVDVLCGGHNTYINCTVPVNEWTHLCSTFDNGISKLYKNGEYIGQLTGRAAFDSDATNTCIGRETYASGYFGFNGLINDVRIYDHVLSTKEVKEISKGLILNYSLDRNLFFTNLMPNYLNMPLGTANPSTGTWRLAGSNSMTRSRVVISDTPDGNGYGFQNSGTQTITTDASCYGIDNFPLAANTIYKISMWARMLEGSDAFAGFEVYNKTILDGSHIKYAQNYYLTPLLENGDWTYCWMTIQTNSVTARNIYIGITTGSTAVTTQMCNVSIEKINNLNLIYDCSGYRNDGTLIGNLSYNSLSSRRSYSSYFKDYTNYIRRDMGTIVPEAITMSCWIKGTNKSAKGGYHIPLNMHGTNFEISITSSSGKARMGYVVGSTRYVSDIGSDILDGQWHMLTSTFDGTVIKRYVDGILINSEKRSGALTSLSTLGVGNFPGGTSYGNTQLYESDVRIYTTALTEEDILELYQASQSVDNKGNLYSYEYYEED